MTFLTLAMFSRKKKKSIVYYNFYRYFTIYFCLKLGNKYKYRKICFTWSISHNVIDSTKGCFVISLIKPPSPHPIIKTWKNKQIYLHTFQLLDFYCPIKYGWLWLKLNTFKTEPYHKKYTINIHIYLIFGLKMQTCRNIYVLLGGNFLFIKNKKLVCNKYIWQILHMFVLSDITERLTLKIFIEIIKLHYGLLEIFIFIYPM